jgi:hypothetical protein
MFFLPLNRDSNLSSVLIWVLLSRKKWMCSRKEQITDCLRGYYG